MKKLEEEAKKFMEQKNNTFFKKLEEIIENVKLIQSMSDITLKKLKKITLYSLILLQPYKKTQLKQWMILLPLQKNTQKTKQPTK